MKKSTFVLLDKDTTEKYEGEVIAHWDDLTAPHHHESIPLRVEEWTTKIRSEYLRWTYDLGYWQIKNKPLAEHLQISPNLSYWWMTSICESSPYKVPSIYTVFKLRALELLYLQESCQEFIYAGSDPTLHKILSKWCETMNHNYRWDSASRFISNKTKKGVTLSTLRSKFDQLPFPAQAIASLIKRWFEKFKHVEKFVPEGCEKKSDEQITIVTYFPNINVEEIEKGAFRSHFWGDLHNVLDEMPVTVNWVWIYFRTESISYADAVAYRDKCNATGNPKHQFFLLEEFLPSSGFLACLTLYLKLFFKERTLKNIEDGFSFKNSQLNFFPLLEKDWKASMLGLPAMDATIYTVLFDNMAKKLTIGSLGLFVWENQPWERAMVSSWRRFSRKTKIVAFQHSVINPMALQLYSHPETFTRHGPESMPQPDLWASNNKTSYLQMKEFYPGDKMVSVESVRYSNLKGKFGSEKKELKKTQRQLLVITSVVRKENLFQLSMLNEAAISGGLELYEKIVVKPHPAHLLERDLRAIKLHFNYTLESRSLTKLFPETDVVYCTNPSGVSLEVAWLGLPLILAGVTNAFNYNLFLGHSGVTFVTHAEELVKQLKEPQRIPITDEYFNFHNKLKLWRKLLNGECFFQ